MFKVVVTVATFTACLPISQAVQDENEWMICFLIKIFTIIATYPVHLGPVFTAFAINLPWIFWFYLLATAFCSGLGITMLRSEHHKNSLCSQKANREIVSNTKVTNASMLCILTAKKGEGKAKEEKTRSAQKCEDRILLLRSFFPQLRNCSSISSRNFA